jgi:hypothetical protein
MTKQKANQTKTIKVCKAKANVYKPSEESP